jgi:type II secretory pathway pseudopilin PulG
MLILFERVAPVLVAHLCKLCGTRSQAANLRRPLAFTVIELFVAIVIIVVLAGLIFATSEYAVKKAKCSRAEGEIAAISTALENYKADNGIYPRDSVTDNLDTATASLSSYEPASLKLYEYLSGDSDDNRIAEAKIYFAFKPNQLSPIDQAQPVKSLRDPFGNPYGYSTMKASDPSKNGYNATFDLWSIADGMAGTDESKWIKNW